jgi:predicted RNA-binding Zn-ribbon protein involved in translation (DUF1610 family)
MTDPTIGVGEAAARAPRLEPTRNGQGDYVCEHGTAMDVHCCHCHSGFIFDRDHECPPDASTVDALIAYGQGESTAALETKNREQYQFWAGWLSALERVAARAPREPLEHFHEGIDWSAVARSALPPLQTQETKEDARVEPFNPRVEATGTTAEPSPGNATAAERTEGGSHAVAPGKARHGSAPCCEGTMAGSHDPQCPMFHFQDAIRSDIRSHDLIERCSEHPDATHELICTTCSLVLTSDERAGMASDCPDGEQHILRCIRCELPATGYESAALPRAPEPDPDRIEAVITQMLYEAAGLGIPCQPERMRNLMFRWADELRAARAGADRRSNE